MNILQLLKEDHQKVKAILTELEETTTRAIKKRVSLLEELKKEILLHEQVEESIFYPVLKEHKETHKIVMEAYEEHHFANVILAEVEKTKPESDEWAAKFMVLKENITHHIKEEENEMFPKVKKVIAKEDLDSMGEEMQEMKKSNEVEA